MMTVLAAGLSKTAAAQSGNGPGKPLQISGVYPHLTVFNEGGGYPCKGDGAEGGIGAITPWAGQLWMVTYSPHCPNGSSDKLYSIDQQLRLTTHPESVGGTPANRLIHRESNQLITGSYFISDKGKVRVLPLSTMPGRMTATARHLTDPANMVYFYDMEGMVYEVNVHTLAAKKLFHKPVPGWHGKGAYTAQGKFIIANNGEHKVFDIRQNDLQVGAAPLNDDEKGVLATWDGQKWEIIERKQFTDITGPGGIYGAPNDKAPAWSIGWDKRSVILKLLDNGKWFTYRLPKATRTYDHWGGWYTEWPRIREMGNGKMLMDMHGMFYDFPKTFTRANSGGIKPIGSHLRYIPDFCEWNGQLVMSTDETTILENPYAGRSQSNLWFGTPAELSNWGPASGWGGPWMNDTVKAGEPSDPYLASGTGKKVLHLSHVGSKPITFTIEADEKGNNQWTVYKKITTGKDGYAYFIFPDNFNASWIRIKAGQNCVATAFLHYGGQLHHQADPMFASLAGIDEAGSFDAQLIRPAGGNKNLQILRITGGEKQYAEIDETLQNVASVGDSTVMMEKILQLKQDFRIDEASVIVKDKTGTFRLPKTSARYDKELAFGWPRGARELESERYMLNAHGTFYEIGRESGFAAIRPVTTHKRKIADYCTWRGLLVISGTKSNAVPNGHYFDTNGPGGGLWFGAIDDLWKLGKPVGEGGLWKNESVKAGVASLPFLMTGYDRKSVTLQSNKTVDITLEVDTDLNGWKMYKTIRVPAGQTIRHTFPAGYNAHWIRAVSDKDCTATVWMKYE